MKIMSMNVLCYGQNEHARENRAPLVAKVIQTAAPDSFGLQEAHIAWMNDIISLFPEYGYVGIGREDGKQEGEFAPVFYLKELYEVEDSGTFWLSETPEVPSKGWDASWKRICTWAKLKNKRTGQIYVHMNTHLDHLGVVAVKESVRLIKARIAGFVGLPVVCTGDFNINQGTEDYLEMVSGSIADARFLARETDSLFTFHNFQPETVQQTIDYIFVTSDSLKPSRFAVMDEKIDGQYYSDHFAVYADMEIIG